MLISLTLAPLVKTKLKSEFLPILLRVNAYQFCIPFCFSTEQNRTNRVDWVRLGSVIELNRTHKKVPVRLCSIAEPIELQSNDWVRLVFGSVSFDWLRWAKSTTRIFFVLALNGRYVWWSGDVFVMMVLELRLHLKATLPLPSVYKNLWPVVVWYFEGKK